MGQCVSTKAAAVGAHTRPMSRPLAQHCSKVPEEVTKDTTKRPYTRGVATSFGFRKRPETAIPVYTDNTRKTSTDVVDSNGNDDRIDTTNNSNTITTSTSRLGTRLPPPKKEPNATRVGRFGFRQSNSARTARTESLNLTATKTKNLNNNTYTTISNNNNTGDRQRPKSVTVLEPRNKVSQQSIKPRSTGLASQVPIPGPAAARYTLHSTQLPRPQLPVRLSDTKTAKTAANINRKVSTGNRSDGSSSKEGSVTGDSGIGSQSGQSEYHELDRSPRPPSRTRQTVPRPRHLQTVPSSRTGCFDVCDLEDDSGEDGVVTEVAVIPLPRLPSVFSSNNISTGIVRERTRDYQRQLENRRHRDCYGEEEKSFKDLSSNEKSNRPSFTTGRNSFIRKSSLNTSSTSSPSDREFEHDWELSAAGEAMLDSRALGDSSLYAPIRPTTIESDISSNRRLSTDSNLMSTSGSSTGAIPKVASTLRSVLLTIEDPFAAVAAKSSVQLLEDETSPQDSLISSFTESEDTSMKDASRRTQQQVTTPSTAPKPIPSSDSTGSKDINERSPLSPASPGTPTNTSLSLSEGRDFLIDDEIADQPALTFDDTIRPSATVDSDDLDLTTTLNETPVKQPPIPANYLNASVDTLSPCESIASDDLMLDFENSMSSGINDSTDRLDDNSALHSLDEVTLRSELQHQHEGIAREWSALLGQRSNRDTHPFASLGRAGELVRSRTNTPSSVPESPRLLNRARVSPANVQRTPATTHGSPHHWRTDESATQDLMEIKSLVLKLQNVLHEREAINPFDNETNLKNGCYDGECNGEENDSAQVADLRKQILFLQSQLEDRDRTVQQLQGRVARFSLNTSLKSRLDNMCNAATQTDRVRPFSAGPSLLQNLPGDSNGALVSGSERLKKSKTSVESETLRRRKQKMKIENCVNKNDTNKKNETVVS